MLNFQEGGKTGLGMRLAICPNFYYINLVPMQVLPSTSEEEGALERG